MWSLALVPQQVTFALSRRVRVVARKEAGRRRIRRCVEDADGDGRADVVLRFRMSETGIALGDTAATLTGRASTGGAFFGTDSFLACPSRRGNATLARRRGWHSDAR